MKPFGIRLLRGARALTSSVEERQLAGERARDDLDGVDDRHDRRDREMWARAEQEMRERER